MRVSEDGSLGRVALFLATGAATGWQTFQLIMWGVWGKPAVPAEKVALIGALVLFGGGIVAIRDPRRGVLVGGVGCVLLWAFYGPAACFVLAQVCAQPAGSDRWGAYTDDPSVLAPLALLAASTLAVLWTAPWRLGDQN